MNGCSMNIGFYFFDKGLSGVDCSRPDLGNPGVGGTQYCFFLLIYYILRFDPKSYRVRVYCSSDCFFPQGVEKVLVEDIFEGLTESKRRGDDFIIIKDNNEILLQAGCVIQCLICHAAGQSAVTDNRNHAVMLFFDIAGADISQSR